MWESVASNLRSQLPTARLDLISLDAYYGAIRALRLRSEWTWRQLPRQRSSKLYWESSWLERAIALQEAQANIGNWMRERRPGLILLGNDIGAIEASLISAARRAAIPTLLVQDGILGAEQLSRPRARSWLRAVGRRVFGLGIGALYGTGRADAIAVMGRHALDLMVARGVAPEALHITGQPRYDAWQPNARWRDSASLRHRLRIDRSRKVVALISQPMTRFGLGTREPWDEIMGQMLDVPEYLDSRYKVVVRLHPAESAADFRGRYDAKLKGGAVEVLDDSDIEVVLGASDLVVVYTSTVALEAMFLGKPVVFFSSVPGFDPYGFARQNAVLTADSAPALSAAIRAALGDPGVKRRLAVGRSRSVRAHAGALDHKAGSRVARLAVRLLKGT